MAHELMVPSELTYGFPAGLEARLYGRQDARRQRRNLAFVLKHATFDP